MHLIIGTPPDLTHLLIVVINLRPCGIIHLKAALRHKGPGSYTLSLQRLHLKGSRHLRADDSLQVCFQRQLQAGSVLSCNMYGLFFVLRFFLILLFLLLHRFLTRIP